LCENVENPRVLSYKLIYRRDIMWTVWITYPQQMWIKWKTPHRGDVYVNVMEKAVRKAGIWGDFDDLIIEYLAGELSTKIVEKREKIVDPRRAAYLSTKNVDKYARIV